MPSQIFVTVNKDAALDTSEKLGCMCRTTSLTRAFATEDRFTSSYGDCS